MVGPMLVFRLFRSKLRKREDHVTRAAAPTDVILHTTPSAPTLPPPAVSAVCTTAITTTAAAAPGTTATTEGGGQVNNGFTPQFLGLWQYPPQYALYNNDKETLVQPVAVERPKFGRGIRKNLSGRWKRLTKKKPVNEVYKIPTELRDQLKSIYVY